MNQNNNNPLWDDPESFLPKDDVPRHKDIWQQWDDIGLLPKGFLSKLDSELTDVAVGVLDHDEAIKQIKVALGSVTSCIETISGDQRDLIKLVGEIIDGLANSREIHQSIGTINETFDVMNSNMEGIVGMVSDITEWISKTGERLNNLEAHAIGLASKGMDEPRDTRSGLGIVPEGGDTCVTPRPLGKDNTRVTHPRPRPDYSADVTYDQELPRPRRYAKAVGLCRLALDVVGALGIGALIAYLYMLING